jgi:serine protease Do
MSVRCLALSAILGWCASGAGTFASGAETENRGQGYSRKTPITEAVAKTRDSIVSIKAEKRRGHGGKEVVGTGVIVDERGYVITNHHVAAVSNDLSIELADGSEYAARPVEDDASHDLAVLQITGRSEDAPMLKALALSSGADLMVGETVIAIGHPYGYKNTVTVGIVSALGREITMPNGEVLTNLIQTSASINPGNSGGPLLNINGQLIGINVALRDGAQGIAFALNAETVKDVLRQRLSAQRLSGVSFGLRCKETVQPDGLDRQHVVVEAVPEQIPGVKKGDEIVAVARRRVTNRFDLERAIWGYRPGEEVNLKVKRGNKELTVAIKLAGVTEAEHVIHTRESAQPTASDARALGTAPGDSH